MHLKKRSSIEAAGRARAPHSGRNLAQVCPGDRERHHLVHHELGGLQPQTGTYYKGARVHGLLMCRPLQHELCQPTFANLDTGNVARAHGPACVIHPQQPLRVRFPLSATEIKHTSSGLPRIKHPASSTCITCMLFQQQRAQGKSGTCTCSQGTLTFLRADIQDCHAFEGAYVKQGPGSLRKAGARQSAAGHRWTASQTRSGLTH